MAVRTSRSWYGLAPSPGAAVEVDDGVGDLRMVPPRVVTPATPPIDREPLALQVTFQISDFARRRHLPLPISPDWPDPLSGLGAAWRMSTDVKRVSA